MGDRVEVRRVWCVRHRDGWCATFGGRRPDPDARNDKTRCGYTVVFRWDSERRLPDCPACLAKMGLRENTLAGWSDNIHGVRPVAPEGRRDGE